MATMLLITALVAGVALAQGQNTCKPKDGVQEECVLVTDCQPLLPLFKKPLPQNVAILRKAHCGYDNKTPKVCCPPTKLEAVDAPTCFAPDGEVGDCRNLYTCPHVLKMLSTKPLNPKVVQFVQNSKCLGRDIYSVCCAKSGKSVLPEPLPKKCEATVYLPDPDAMCCGRDSGTSNKIIGGNETSIEEYPWLALIEYQGHKTIKLLCGGVLISARYVLTAGHCVAPDETRSSDPVNIRLGEYNTSSSGPDCVPGVADSMECNGGALVIPIEKIIPHPEYKPRTFNKLHDIALIRMKENAPFNDYIRPICLPTSDVTLAPPEDFVMYAAGWGAVNETKPASTVKMHVDLPFVNQEQCQRVYSVPKRNVPISRSQMCAGGEAGKDTCKGDSGGPLMYENVRTFEIIGIVSFGPLPCGSEDIPGVYTKVFEYKSWIRSHVRP